MAVTTEQVQKICLLSDGELYKNAVDFVKTYYSPKKVSKAQLSGLQNAVGASDLHEIFRYINNRLARNTTPEDLKSFYGALKDSLNSLRSKVQEVQFVVKPEKTTRTQDREVKKEIDQYAYLLAKEYIQHLIAEYNYQRTLSDARDA